MDLSFFNDESLKVLILVQARNVYVLNRSHLNRIQNLGLNKCVRCNVAFAEKDVIATSTSNRYCYDCAVKINLVSGNARKDLRNDEFLRNAINQIKKLTKKYSINNETSSFAIFLLKTAFEKNNHVTKNQLGLSCAALSLASKLLGKVDFWINCLPISPNVLGKNISQLQKGLKDEDITFRTIKTSRRL